MTWIEASRDTAWIAALYREIHRRDCTVFRHWALDHLAERVSFSSVAWLAHRRDSDRVTALVARNLTPDALQSLLALGAGLWRVPTTDRSYGAAAVAQFEIAELAPRHARMEELLAQGYAQAFVAACPQRGTLFTTTLCLLRRTADRPFSYDDCERLRTLLPHLAEAETLELEQRVGLDLRLAQAGRRNRGPGCLADESGAVRAMAPAFGELLRRRLPHWDGLRLPPELAPQSEADGTVRNVALAEFGLHARCMSSVDNFFEVHIRPTHPFDRLSEREHDIVKAIVEGESYKVAARRLGVSASTVANHASNIYRKLGALNREQVVVLATSFRGQPGDPPG